MARPRHYANTEMSEVASYNSVMAKKIKLANGSVTTVGQVSDADFREWANTMLNRMQTSKQQTIFGTLRREIRKERMDTYARFYYLNEIVNLNRAKRIELFVEEKRAS